MGAFAEGMDYAKQRFHRELAMKLWIGQHEGPGKPLILETLSRTKGECEKMLNAGPFFGSRAIQVKVTLPPSR
jgi:hypothetical protein